MTNKRVRIITKQTAVPGRIPSGTTGEETNLVKQGELAQNTTDKKLFGYNGSNIFEFGVNSFFSITGGTISGNIITNSLSSTTYFGLPTDVYITGGSYNNGIIIFGNSTGGTFSVTGLSTSTSSSIFTGGTVIGETYFTNGLSATSISATTYFGLPTDIYITGGTYSAGTTTFYNSTGGSFTIVGFSTGGTSSGVWTSSTGVNSIIANNGTGNFASGNFAIIGGSGNTSYSIGSFVGNGIGNTVSGSSSFIGNGVYNLASGDTSFIGNGSGNTANGRYSTVVNGIYNESLGRSSMILGGDYNYTYPNTVYAIILGGSGNTVYNMPGMGGTPPAPCGGSFYPPCSFNLPHHTFNMIGNGNNNVIKDQTTYCIVLNGTLNEISTGNSFSYILNGNNNLVYTGSNYSHILNGSSNGIGNLSSDVNINYTSILNGSGNTISVSGATIINGFKVSLIGGAYNSASIGLSNFTGTSANTLYTASASLANAGGVILSAGTNLYDIFEIQGVAEVIRVQPGSNIVTGGTGIVPVISIVDSPSFNGLTLSGNGIFAGVTAYSASATTISATTFYGNGAFLTGIVAGTTFTGGTVSGFTSFLNGISAYGTGTTFQVSGSTGNLFSIVDAIGGSLLDVNNSSGTTIFQVTTGYTLTNNLTATTISATTFYGNGAFLTGIVAGAIFTGGTVTGATNFTGGLKSNTISATTITGTTIYATGLAATAVTSSGIVYVLADSKLQTDIADLVWDDTNKKLGINQRANTPSANLDVHGNGITTGITFQVANSAATPTFTILDSGAASHTGSLSISGNSTIFTVSGAISELFSVTDGLSSSLFQVNDALTNTVFNVFSGNTILMGNYLAPSLNSTMIITANTGTTSVYNIPTSAYTGAFFDYTINNVNTNYRAGNVMAIWNTGTTVRYSETATNDIGTTTPLTFNVVVSAGTASLNVSATTNNWVVKVIVRSI